MVFPPQAEEFPLAKAGAQGEFEQCGEPVPPGGIEELAGFVVGGEGVESARLGCAGADVSGDAANDIAMRRVAVQVSAVQ